TGEEVVELVGPADLDVRFDRDRVVRLHERIEELGDGDRLVLAEAFREVVSFEYSRDRDRATEPHDVRVRELAEPFAVEADFGPVAVEHAERLVRERLR